MKVTDIILRAIGGSILSTSAIENIGISVGFTQSQVLGGIGYLRSKGMLTIVAPTITGGREEHLFRV